MIEENQGHRGRLGSDEPTALAPPSGVEPASSLQQSRSSTDAAEALRKATNLRCAGNAAADAELREVLAPKIAVTCERTAEWIEGIASLLNTRAWQPIETAPKDGSYVLGFGPHQTRGTYMDVVHFYRDRWTITWMEGYGEPTHWQPLPAAPVQP